MTASTDEWMDLTETRIIEFLASNEDRLAAADSWARNSLASDEYLAFRPLGVPSQSTPAAAVFQAADAFLVNGHVSRPRR
jgi:hypothetical protein